MAKILSENLYDARYLENGLSGELKTLNLLKEQLSDDYWALHSVNWTKKQTHKTSIGEIDFVIFNSSGKVLFVEQKNGELDVENGNLIKTYNNGASKNVLDQIHRSVDLVQNKFNRQTNGLKLSPEYLICLPDYKIQNFQSVGLERRNIVDCTDYKNIGKKVEKLIPSTSPNKDRFEVLKKFFTNVFDVVPDIHTRISTLNENFTAKAGFLSDVLENISMQPYKLRVNATAGSGKSLFAANFYMSLIEEKKKSAVICFNRNLAERLKARLPAGGYINTFHGLCDDFIKSQGIQLNYDDANKSEFWRDLLKHVLDCEIPNDWLFDHITIDEGQDFEQEWYEIIRLFLKDDGGILWLEDSNQNVYSKQPVKLENFVYFTCNKNFRTPNSIAAYISKTLDIEIEAGNPIDGLGCNIFSANSEEDQFKKLQQVLNELKEKKFKRNEIVIISLKGVGKSFLSEINQIENTKLKKFTGKYDALGNQIFTEGDIEFETIYRFKGSQSPAVILVDVETLAPKNKRQKHILFCAMTRATVRLDIIQFDNK